MTMHVRTAAAERSPWRWPAAAIAFIVAASHVPITGEHLAEAPYIGWSFVALEVAALALAAALALRDVAVVWWAAAVVPTLAILAFVVTRTVALPEIADDVGNWTEPLGFVALAAEGSLVVLALAHGTVAWRSSPLASRPMLLGGALLLTGLVATGCAAAVTTG